MSFDLSSIFKNIKPGNDGTVVGEISFNLMFQQFLPKFRVVRSVINSPYIYVYLDVPVNEIVSEGNELAKKLVDGAQLRLTLKEKEIMQILSVTSLTIEGFKQDGDDILIVVRAKVANANAGVNTGVNAGTNAGANAW